MISRKCMRRSVKSLRGKISRRKIVLSSSYLSLWTGSEGEEVGERVGEGGRRRECKVIL